MNEIFKAIYDRLTAQLSESVYDHVPQDLDVFPYVRIDPLEAEPNDTDTELGFIATAQIITFSRYRGSKETNDIMTNIYTALHRYAIPDTASYGISGIKETFRQTAVEDDGLTRVGVQRYTITFEQLPT